MIVIEILFILFLILNVMGVTAIYWPVFVWCFIAYSAVTLLSMINPKGKRVKRR